jgi:hypothetical protein
MRRGVLVVWVLGSYLVQLSDDGDLLLDGCLDLSNQRGVCIGASVKVFFNA